MTYLMNLTEDIPDKWPERDKKNNKGPGDIKNDKFLARSGIVNVSEGKNNPHQKLGEEEQKYPDPINIPFSGFSDPAPDNK